MDFPTSRRPSAGAPESPIGRAPELNVTDELATVKEELQRRWTTVFIGQSSPAWPGKESINDAIIAAVDRLESAREQYYKERLHVDCLERLCSAMKVVPVTTFVDHSVSSGYLHHLRSSMSNLGLEELSLTDLEGKRRQTFSSMAEIKQQQQPSLFRSSSQRRAGSRRLLASGSGLGGRSATSTNLNTPVVTRPAPTGNDKGLTVTGNTPPNSKEGEARRLSLVNYFASKRVASDEKSDSAPSITTTNAAPRLKPSNMRKSFNKKAASLLGRGSSHSKVDNDGESPSIDDSARYRSLSDSAPRAGKPSDAKVSSGIKGKASASSISISSHSDGSEVRRDPTTPGTIEGEVFSPQSQSPTQDRAAPPAGSHLYVARGPSNPSIPEASPIAIPKASASHILTRQPETDDSKVHQPKEAVESRSEDDVGKANENHVSKEALDGAEARRASSDSELGQTDKGAVPAKTYSKTYSIAESSGTAEGGTLPSELSADDTIEVSDDEEEEQGTGTPIEQTVSVLFPSPSPPTVADSVYPFLSENTEATLKFRREGRAMSDDTEEWGSPKPVVRSSMNFSCDGQETPDTSKQTSKASSRTSVDSKGQSLAKDEPSQVLLERINTISRRNRIMSIRRRSGVDSNACPILTAESVNTMDFVRMAIAGFVDGEKVYRNTLRTVYFNFYKPLKAVANSSQPICSMHDVDTIFYNMEELYSMHNAITVSLEPLASSDFLKLHTLPETFKILMPKLDYYRFYKNNFAKAIEVVGRLRVDSPAFQAFLDNASQIKVKGRRVEPLEEMLRAPMVRLESYRSLLADLCSPELMSVGSEGNIKYYDLKELQMLLDQLTDYITRLQDGAAPEKLMWTRKLVKAAVCVEFHESKRKFRHVILFNDTILCATRARSKSKGNAQTAHDCKWFLPLEELTWHPPTDVPMDPISPVTPTSTAELAQYQTKINKLKGDLKHSDQAKKKFGLKHDRERKKKNLLDLEMMLKMLQHNQVVRLFSRTGKVHTLLFAEHAEKAEWAAAIEDCQAEMLNRQPGFSSGTSTVDINQMLFMAKGSIAKQEEEVKAYIEDDDVELLDGLLVVLVDCAYGLKSKGKTEIFSQLEVDTYGRSERKAKTKCVQYSIKPEWDQGFEVELEAAHSMTVQIYESRMLSDYVIAKGMIELVSYGLLDQEIHTIDLPLQPQGQLSMKLQYLTPEMMLKRSEMMKANTTTAVFGVRLELITIRECDLIPNIVRLCAEEVEKRGLEETGVYRISGLASDVKMLREAFDVDIDQAEKLVKEVDIHAVTGALKLFLREMPEPLFPRVLYNRFVEGSNLSNIDSRISCMVSLLYSMPDANLLTTLYLIKHFKTVSQFSATNKMTSSNLATVIGPNVLKPIDDGADRIVLDVGNQVSIFGFFVDLRLDLLEPEERDVDGYSVQEVLSSTSMTKIGIMTSRSTDSANMGRESPGGAGLTRGYLDIYSKT